MFRDKIKSLRIDNNLNQEQVAKMIDVTKQTYAKYENGKQSPQLTAVDKLAQLYGVPINELIEEKKPSIDERINAKLDLIKNLSDKEKESIIMVIEGVIFKNLSKNLNEKFG